MSLLIVEADLANLFKFQEAAAALGMGKVRQIAGWTLNQVGGKLATQVKRSLVQQTGLTYGEVGGDITIEPAHAGNLEWKMTGAGKYWPVAHFGAHQFSYGVRARPYGVSRSFAGAFMARGRVYARITRARYPLHVLTGPAVPREMERDAVPQDFIEHAENELPGAIDKKLNQMLPF